MAISKWKRKTFIVLGAAALIAAALVASLPFWLSSILPRVARSRGADYSGYHREGYGRFALTGVTFTNDGVRFTAKRMEAVVPTVWLWRRYFGRKPDTSPFLKIQDWRLDVIARNEREPGRKPVTSVPAVLDEIELVFRDVRKWVPLAVVSNGIVSVQGKDIRIADARWEQGTLNARVSVEQRKEIATIRLAAAKEFPWELNVAVPELGFESEWKISKSANAASLQGEALWRSNTVQVTARFDRKGWLPDTAALRAENLRLPSDLIKIEGYGDVTGSLLAEWQEQQCQIHLTADAQLRHEQTNLPPVAVRIGASGGTNGLRIETATASSPWFKLNLSSPIDLDFKGRLRGQPAEFRVVADLDHQPWLKAGGRVDATAFVQRGTNDWPEVSFNLAGAHLRILEMHATHATMRGHFGWPWLDIENAACELGGGAKIGMTATLNITNRTFTKGSLQFNGGLPRGFLPPEISCEKVSLSGEFSGPFRQIIHSGELEVDKLKFPRLNPLQVQMRWKGRQIALDEIQTTVRAGKTSAQLAGAVSVTNSGARVQVDQLTLEKAEQPTLKLGNPTLIEFHRLPAATNTATTVLVKKFQWEGDGTSISGEADLLWPAHGNIAVALQSVRANFFQDFVQSELPKLTAETLAFAARWSNGPVLFNVTSTAKLSVQDERELSGSVQATGTAEGIVIQSLSLASGEDAVVTGTGRVPITIQPASDRLIHASVKEPLDFQAQVRAHKSFWDDISKLLHARLVEPDVRVMVSGTLESPQGTVTVHIPEVQWLLAEPDEEFPPLKNVEARILLDRQRARVEQLSLLVEEQPVTARGDVPFEFGKGWGDLVQWDKASATVEVKDVKVAAAAKFFPEILLPYGTVNVSARLEPGLQVHGELQLRGAAMRPMLAVGAVHDVDANLKLNGREIEIEDVHGLLGGQPVSAKGKVELPEKDFKAGLAAIDVHLQGQNIPLVRQSEIVVRSDVDATVTKSKNGRAVISGKLNLRDSVFLSDLKELVPGRVARAGLPPPYFSIATQPFADWRLDLTVSGDRFLKVRGPLFRGEVSAALKGQGTLRDPVVLGQVTIPSGTVQFPFGSLKVSQGFVLLTSENPYQPRLSIAAGSRVFGYEVKMNVSGFAGDPIIEFSSTPPLSSEQIVLMLTSGQLPKDEREFSASQRAGRFALFMGKNLLAKLGLESDSDRLTFRSGEDLSEKGGQTYYVEFKLTDKLSLVGEYDRFNALNAGVKWRVYSK